MNTDSNNNSNNALENNTVTPKPDAVRDPSYKRLSLVREIIRVNTGIRVGQGCNEGPTTCTR